MTGQQAERDTSNILALALLASRRGVAKTVSSVWPFDPDRSPYSSGYQAAALDATPPPGRDQVDSEHEEPQEMRRRGHTARRRWNARGLCCELARKPRTMLCWPGVRAGGGEGWKSLDRPIGKQIMRLELLRIAVAGMVGGSVAAAALATTVTGQDAAKENTPSRATLLATRRSTPSSPIGNCACVYPRTWIAKNAGRSRWRASRLVRESSMRITFRATEGVFEADEYADIYGLAGVDAEGAEHYLNLQRSSEREPADED